MKKILLTAFSFAVTFYAFNQTTLFSDNFETATSNWTLNSGGSGNNTWIVNNSYTGFTGVIPNTQNQPASFTNQPTSNYLHIHNLDIAGMLGISNANFDTGSASNHDATMTNSISTVGATNVTFSYWYLCSGQASTSEGKVYYSTDDGASWTILSTYSGVSTWTQATHTLPAFEGQATLKFKFNWVNGGSGTDPAFSVDEVEITGQTSATSTIDNISLTNTNPWCEGTAHSMDVSFDATGTYNTGNVFTAQLSDASGSFATPTNVGSLSIATSGLHTISATIPGSTPSGNAYRIRVISSDPAITSTSDNGNDLVINPTPTVSLNPLSAVCDNDAAFALSGGSPSGGVYAGSGVSSGNFDPAIAGPGTWPITYTYTSTDGCSAMATENIVVNGCAGIEDAQALDLLVYPNPVEDILNIKGTQITSVQVYDLLGKQVANFEGNKTTYNLTSLKSGAYFVKINVSNNHHMVKIQVK